MARYTSEERKRMRALKRLSSSRDSEWEGVISHSTLYHRVFEGYSERQVPKENGKGMRIERIYVGNHFIRQGTAKAFVLTRLLYVVLYLIAVGCAITAFAQPTGYNSVWYGVIPMFGLIITLILFVSNLLSCLAAPQKMEAYHYNCFGKLITSALVISIISLVYALLALVYFAVTGIGDGIALTCLFACLTAVLFFALFSIERNTQYEVIESNSDLHSDAVVIS